MKQTLLYAEEFENHFVNALLERNDVDLILLRFLQNMNFSQEHLRKTAGIPVFILDKNVPPEAQCSSFRQFLASNGRKIDFFFNDSEYNQEYVQRFANTLNLRGSLSEEQALTVRDKIFMKDFIRRLGYDCMDYMLLKCREDVIQCSKNWDWPIIIKWRRCMSSIEVYKVSSEQELDSLNLDYSSMRYMAERFCPDKIWCIDSVVSKGKVVENLYTWLPFTNLDFAENKKRFTQLAFGKKQDSWRFLPAKLTFDIVSALGLSSGYLHLEVFITDDGRPIICEFAWRTPGDHMLSNFSILYNKSVPDLLIDAILEKPVPPLCENNCCAGDVFLPMSDGEVTEITEIEELRSIPGVVDGEIYYKRGDVLKSKHKYTDCSGWVQIKTGEQGEALRLIDRIYKTFHIETRKP